MQALNMCNNASTETCVCVKSTRVSKYVCVCINASAETCACAKSIQVLKHM